MLEFRKNDFTPTAHARGPSSLPAGAQMCGYRAHRDGVYSVGLTLHLWRANFKTFANIQRDFSTLFMEHNLEVANRLLGDFSQLKEMKD
jgi:hypothetical protein